MDELIKTVEELKESEIKEVIDERIKEFEEVGKSSSGEIFNELCFCLLTANFNAKKSIKIQNEIGDGFQTLPESKLADKLSEMGHRYPNARAKYIVEARKYSNSLSEIIDRFSSEDSLREWIVENIKGLGYKESSHFLRNIGFKNLAIIDFHIIDLLVRHELIERPKTLTKKRYKEIEYLLKKLAEKVDLNLAELDLYLWYSETGKVLK